MSCRSSFPSHAGALLAAVSMFWSTGCWNSDSNTTTQQPVDSGEYQPPDGPREPRIAVPEVAPTAPVRPEDAEPIVVSADDWPWWRGPTYDGRSTATNVPLEFSDVDGTRKNIIWKQAVPGRGFSSPCVWGDRIFLTTADDANQIQFALCFDRGTGKPLWTTEIHRGNFESADRMHLDSSHATPTAACDGQRVYVSFLNDRAIWTTALDLDGNQVWQRKVGEYDSKQGYAASPVLQGGHVIVAGDNWGSGWLAALDRRTGEIVWRTNRPAAESYSTPFPSEVNGEPRLFLCGANIVASYDGLTGKALWTAPGTSLQTIGTMVREGDLVFASGGWPEDPVMIMAIHADTGEVAWRDSTQVWLASMLVHDGLLYGFRDNGIAICWDAGTGKLRWRERFGGSLSSSPVLVEDRIYHFARDGACRVFRASGEGYEELAKSQLGRETFSSPAICGGRIYMRITDFGAQGSRPESLYCIGKAEESTEASAEK
ncbi:MAG: PQQ-binding-like beta-propeller repeat protein [Planctomycetaceae bacterium]